MKEFVTNFMSEPINVMVLISIIKVLVVFGAVLTSVPFMVLLERVLIARIQHRVGPNRVGFQALTTFPIIKNLPEPILKILRIPTNWFIIGGILQTLVDGGKLFLKEDSYPDTVERPLHTLAPLLTIVPAILLLAILPLGPVINLTIFGVQYEVPLGITDLDIGILYYLAITGVAVYGIVLAGWSSNSKYSLLGGVRSCAQMLSYEIAMGLSVIGVLLLAGTFSFRELIAQQGDHFWNWNLIRQPVGFILFMIAGFAETNRLPFDLPEGESELGGGFHTEYSSMKFAMFFMAEYMNMFVFSAILTTLFLGGFNAPLPFLNPAAPYSILHGVIGVAWFSIKIFLLICFMIFIRGTWPRFRYDQLMDLGWKVLFPLALVNLVVTAAVVMVAHVIHPGQAAITPGLTAALFVAGAVQLLAVDRLLLIRRKRALQYV